MRSKNGFTLVELLAVIAILAILVIIALPNVINMYNKAQKETFLTEAKKIYSEAEKKYISSSVSGNTLKTISSKDNSKLDMTGEKLQYCVILDNSGKVTNMKVSNGKWIASLEDGKSVEDLTIDDLKEGNLDGYKCSGNSPKVPNPTNCTFDGELKQGVEYVNGQYTYRYMQERTSSSEEKYKWNNITTDGWGVTLTDKDSTDPVTSKVCTYINDKPVVSMSYMYFKSKSPSIDLSSLNTSKVTNMSGMFWLSVVDNLNVSTFDTSSVTNMSKMFFVCENLNSLDISNFDTSTVTDMDGMFGYSSATTIKGLNNLDTSNVIDMTDMFSYSAVSNLNLSNFNTSKVKKMDCMFCGSKATSINLSGFDTSKVTSMGSMFTASNATTIIGLNDFNTSNVTDMSLMFWASNVKVLDLSSFDISNVTDMRTMFDSVAATTGYAKDQATADKFNDSSVTKIPDTLKFIVK